MTTKKGDIHKFLDEVVFKYSGDDCLEWPFSVDIHGYGKITKRPRTFGAHRYVCEVAHGKPQGKKMEAAHTCGNRKCVNYKHIRWATPKENAADKEKHGTSIRGEDSPNAKMTWDDVREIRVVYGHLTQKEIAEIYPTSKTSVSKIIRKESWWPDPTFHN